MIPGTEHGMPDPGITSPCIDLCRMSDDGSHCIGCYRTLEEIVRWSKADDKEKRAILAAVARRRSQLDPAADLGGIRRN